MSSPSIAPRKAALAGAIPYIRDLFTNKPNFTPYNYTPIAFDGTPNATWKAMTQNLNFSTPDANEVELRQAIALSEGIPRRKPGKKK